MCTSSLEVLEGTLPPSPEAQVGLLPTIQASGDLDKLATQNRFLELKYQEAKDLGR